MTFTVDFGNEFAKEWPQFSQDQRLKVGQFVALVKAHGLDQTKLPGKLSASWINASQADHAYTTKHALWHYHIGYPVYRANGPGRPMTSEWLLHFQVLSSNHIAVVDLYEHYMWNGQFYLPKAHRLVTQPPPPATPSSSQGVPPPEADDTCRPPGSK